MIRNGNELRQESAKKWACSLMRDINWNGFVRSAFTIHLLTYLCAHCVQTGEYFVMGPCRSEIVHTFLLLLGIPACVFACHFTDNLAGAGVASEGPRLMPCEELCKMEFKGNCQCDVIRRDSASAAIRLKCSHTNASMLVADIDNMGTCTLNLNLVALHVSNSNLTRLYHLPSGLYNIQELVLENTGIDLETIRESYELLRSLRILRISNENYTEVKLFSQVWRLVCD